VRLVLVPNGERAATLIRRLAGREVAGMSLLDDGRLELRPLSGKPGARHAAEGLAAGTWLGELTAVEKMELRGLLAIAEVRNVA